MMKIATYYLVLQGALAMRLLPPKIQVKPSGSAGAFGDWMMQFNRKYQHGSNEFIMRQQAFEKNMAEIEMHNARKDKTYTMAVNKFADWSDEEFKKMLGYKRTEKKGGVSFMEVNQSFKVGPSALPDVHDWRDKLGWTNNMFQDQGHCGCCWATSTVEVLQNHLMLGGGSGAWDMLSPQALVDCVANPKQCGGTGGCEGATTQLAFGYIKENGIPANHFYPYTSFTGKDGVCNKFLASGKHATITSWVDLPSNRADPLKQALYESGPVTVSVDATNWKSYKSGVYNGCDRNAIINHAVVAQGYGKESEALKYYLIKNSWGQDWGDNGYIKLQRFDADNAFCGMDTNPLEGSGCLGGPSQVRVCGMCGVTSDSSYPLGARVVHRQEGGTFDVNEVAAIMPFETSVHKMAEGVIKPYDVGVHR